MKLYTYFINHFKQLIHKVLILFFIFVFTFSFVYADDIDDELLDIETSSHKSIALETSSNTYFPSELSSINSRAFVVLDRKTNKVLLGKKENECRKMASTTKIMTATVVLETCKNLNETIKISKKAGSVGGSRLGLKTGDKINIYDLLYGLMLKSGNDCAIALAEYTSGTVEEFANLMNQKATEIRTL